MGDSRERSSHPHTLTPSFSSSRELSDVAPDLEGPAVPGQAQAQAVVATTSPEGWVREAATATAIGEATYYFRGVD